MQHDLFAYPNRRARLIYPLVVVLHADVVEAETRIVAPLTTRHRAQSTDARAARGGA
jgi:hypothetical protein